MVFLCLAPTSFTPTKHPLTPSHRYRHDRHRTVACSFKSYPFQLLSSRPANSTLKCSAQRPPTQQPQPPPPPPDQVERYEFKRLFSNLNQASLKREPGSLTGAMFLVAGTTIFHPL